MSTIVLNCARCGAKRSTHDCYANNWIGIRHDWVNYSEVFVVCRACGRSSIAVISQKNPGSDLSRLFSENNKLAQFEGSLDGLVEFERVVSNLDNAQNEPPDHLPQNIDAVMREANKCLSADCWNAAAAMYRLGLDLATKDLLPQGDEPNAKVRRNLGLRLPWLFEQGLLPGDLKALAECLQQDGNDGAHDGTLSKEDAEDLHDFSFELLRRVFTEPERLRLAEQRRLKRRQTPEA